MKMKSVSYSLIMAFVLFSGCRAARTVSLESHYARLDEVSHDKWKALANKRVFFGHKSVGLEIIAGLNDVMKKYPAVRLDIRETTDPHSFDQPVFAHALLGENTFSQSKIAAFQRIMESGVGQSVDIAFFKFCYVDIDHQTDLSALLENYAQVMESLTAQFPDTKFITFTMPLVSRLVGPKAQVKKMLGRLPHFFFDISHVQRSLYNDMVRARFKGNLFDIAAVESRINESKKAVFKKNGMEYELLYRGYTHDGSHLNLVGRQIVAIELLLHLASIT